MPITPIKRARKAGAAAPPADWPSIWAISVGLAAMLIASIVYFAAGDQAGAGLVLLGAAGVIALVAYASAHESEDSS